MFHICFFSTGVQTFLFITLVQMISQAKINRNKSVNTQAPKLLIKLILKYPVSQMSACVDKAYEASSHAAVWFVFSEIAAT